MATLTEVSVIARKGVVMGIGFVVFLMFYPLIRAGLIAIYLKYNPPPPPPPTSIWGKLPVIDFPKIDFPSKTEIKLETISGGFPKMPTTSKVYLVEINKSRLSTLDAYRQKATALGLQTEPVQTDEIRYRFNHPTVLANMTVNLVTNQVEYKYDWTKDKDSILPGELGAPNLEIEAARGYISRLGFLHEDILKGTGKVTYYVASGSAMIPTSNYVEASFARVDLFRSDLDNLKFVTPGAEYSPISVTFSSTRKSEQKLVAISYYYSKLVDKNTFSTYKLKSPEKAFQELSEGKGFVVRNAPPTTSIRNISLAYYESNNPQDYIQPVYVFSGDRGYLAYVQAVDESSLVSNSSPTP